MSIGQLVLDYSVVEVKTDHNGLSLVAIKVPKEVADKLIHDINVRRVVPLDVSILKMPKLRLNWEV